MSKEYFAELENDIKAAYETSVTMEEAERLAAKFLHGQLVVSSALTKADLESRMRKSGVKAVRAAIYLESKNKSETKVTEASLEHILNSDQLVINEQTGLDDSEAEKNELDRLFSVFQNAHIYFRGIAKGRFE